jgi:hypothetical protein
MRRRVKVATLVHWKDPAKMMWQLMFTCGHIKFIDIVWKARAPSVDVCNAPATGYCNACERIE